MLLIEDRSRVAAGGPHTSGGMIGQRVGCLPLEFSDFDADSCFVEAGEQMNMRCGDGNDQRLGIDGSRFGQNGIQGDALLLSVQPDGPALEFAPCPLMQKMVLAGWGWEFLCAAGMDAVVVAAEAARIAGEPCAVDVPGDVEPGPGHDGQFTRSVDDLEAGKRRTEKWKKKEKG